MIRLAAVAFWIGVLVANLFSVLLFVGADSDEWRWLGLGLGLIAAVATLAVGRSGIMVKVLVALSLSHWDDAYERDYCTTVGVHPGPVVFGVLTLLWVAAGTLLLLFG